MKRDVYKNKDVEFLNWLKNRLKNKYDEDDLVIDNLDRIINTKKIVNKAIDVSVVEHICCSLWPNFNNASSDYFCGIDEMNSKEKDDIRLLVTKILAEARKSQV